LTADGAKPTGQALPAPGNPPNITAIGMLDHSSGLLGAPGMP
jgi:hypothetical protein